MLDIWNAANRSLHTSVCTGLMLVTSCQMWSVKVVLAQRSCPRSCRGTSSHTLLHANVSYIVHKLDARPFANLSASRSHLPRLQQSYSVHRETLVLRLHAIAKHCNYHDVSYWLAMLRSIFDADGLCRLHQCTEAKLDAQFVLALVGADGRKEMTSKQFAAAVRQVHLCPCQHAAETKCLTRLTLRTHTAELDPCGTLHHSICLQGTTCVTHSLLVLSVAQTHIALRPPVGVAGAEMTNSTDAAYDS